MSSTFAKRILSEMSRNTGSLPKLNKLLDELTLLGITVTTTDIFGYLIYEIQYLNEREHNITDLLIKKMISNSRVIEDINANCNFVYGHLLTALIHNDLVDSTEEMLKRNDININQFSEARWTPLVASVTIPDDKTAITLLERPDISISRKYREGLHMHPVKIILSNKNLDKDKSLFLMRKILELITQEDSDYPVDDFLEDITKNEFNDSAKRYEKEEVLTQFMKEVLLGY